MTNLGLPPPEPAPATNSPPPSDGAPADPTSLGAPQADPQQEEWYKSLKNLEHHVVSYKEHRTNQGAVPDEEVEQVAQAMEQVASSHPDPKVKSHWRQRAEAFRLASSDDRDGILEDIGKGFLMLLTTPFFLVGAVLQAAGGILNGVGSILKGLGGLARKLSYTGASKKGASVDVESSRESRR